MASSSGDGGSLLGATRSMKAERTARRIAMQASNQRRAVADKHCARIVKETNATQREMGAPLMSQGEIDKLHEQLMRRDSVIQFHVEKGPEATVPTIAQTPHDVHKAYTEAIDRGDARVVTIGMEGDVLPDFIAQAIAGRMNDQLPDDGFTRQWVTAGHGDGFVDIATDSTKSDAITEKFARSEDRGEGVIGEGVEAPPTAQTVAEVRRQLLQMPRDDVVQMLAVMEEQDERGTATIENSPVHPLFVQAAGAMGRG